MALTPMGSAEFKSSISSEHVLVAYFWTNWHEACQDVTPILEALAKNYEGKATICSINADEEGFLAIDLGVYTTPLVIVYQDGEEVDRIVGIQPHKVYDQVIDDCVNSKEIDPYELINAMGHIG